MPDNKQTLRTMIIQNFGVAGQVGLDTFEKGGKGLKLHVDKSGQGVAEVTTDKDTLEIYGQKFKREDVKKIIDQSMQ